MTDPPRGIPPRTVPGSGGVEGVRVLLREASLRFGEPQGNGSLSRGPPETGRKRGPWVPKTVEGKIQRVVPPGGLGGRAPGRVARRAGPGAGREAGVCAQECARPARPRGPRGRERPGTPLRGRRVTPTSLGSCVLRLEAPDLRLVREPWRDACTQTFLRSGGAFRGVAGRPEGGGRRRPGAPGPHRGYLTPRPGSARAKPALTPS